MDLLKLSRGDAPWSVNVVVEIPQGSTQHVKYEFDKNSGALMVDRFLHTAMYYPANYGFVPHTLSEDGDPIDVLVVCQTAVVPGAVMRSRPIGALLLEDEHGVDEKILAVPVDELHPFYSDVHGPGDLPATLLDQIAHFFKHYKDLEHAKWVSVGRWIGADEAARMIEASVARFEREATPKTARV